MARGRRNDPVEGESEEERGNCWIREPVEGDACRIAELLGELGYPQTAEAITPRLLELSDSASDIVLVAERGGDVVAMAHLHTALMAHFPGKLGRVMALVVANGWRGCGVGSSMVHILEDRARESGCTRMEVTSNASRNEAHTFYEKMGYRAEPKRFVKELW